MPIVVCLGGPSGAGAQTGQVISEQVILVQHGLILRMQLLHHGRRIMSAASVHHCTLLHTTLRAHHMGVPRSSHPKSLRHHTVLLMAGLLSQCEPLVQGAQLLHLSRHDIRLYVQASTITERLSET